MGVRVPPFALIAFAMAVLGSGSCRSEGQKLVDELASPLHEAAAAMAAPAQGQSPERAALEVLESRALRARQIETKLDDVVKTLNRDQKKALAEYATSRTSGAALHLSATLFP